MVEVGNAGDETAKQLNDKYRFRPEFELYDSEADPLEMVNLADDPQYESVIKSLKNRLDQWMASQGDQGVETELDALSRLKKFQGLTRRQAVERWLGRKADN